MWLASPNWLKIYAVRRSVLNRGRLRPTAKPDAGFFRDGPLRMDAPGDGCPARGNGSQRKD